MLTIRREDLKEELLQRKGASAVSIVAETEPAWRKSLKIVPIDGLTKVLNPHIGQVTKVSRVSAMINWKYANSVNNQRAREQQPTSESGQVEHFHAQPRTWGTRLKRDDGTLTPLVEHKGRYYLECKVERTLGHEYRRRDGSIIADEQIHPWLRKRSTSTRQGVDKEIILRDYALDSLRELRMDGQVYTVIDEEQP